MTHDPKDMPERIVAYIGENAFSSSVPYWTEDVGREFADQDRAEYVRADSVARLRVFAERAVGVLRANEWSGIGVLPKCLACEGVSPEILGDDPRAGHRPECLLSAILRDAADVLK